VFGAAFLVATCISVRPAFGQENLASDVDIQSLIECLDAAEKEIRILKAEKFESTPSEQIFDSVATSSFTTFNGLGLCGAGTCGQAGCDSDAGGTAKPGSKFYVDYDKGFVVRPYDKQKTPFELKINGRMQFRYNDFKSDGPTPSRNNFEVERGRVVLRGFVFDPALQYFINIDADTDDNHDMKFHDFWVNYTFSDAFNLHAGKGKISG
jgi:hypothetical protein